MAAAGASLPIALIVRGGLQETHFEKEHNSVNANGVFKHHSTLVSSTGFPGFEHTPPLCYHRRRDDHDVRRRGEANVVGPFLEMPWGRSKQGQAWDGLPRYDLSTFNPWYFARIKEFADLWNRKGCILVFYFYNQHNLLETQAHYCDFPSCPVNCIQATDLPDTTPAAYAFYETMHRLRRELHRKYITHCFDNLRDNRNVVFLTSLEYTGRGRSCCSGSRRSWNGSARGRRACVEPCEFGEWNETLLFGFYFHKSRGMIG